MTETTRDAARNNAANALAALKDWWLYKTGGEQQPTAGEEVPMHVAIQIAGVSYKIPMVYDDDEVLYNALFDCLNTMQHFFDEN